MTTPEVAQIICFMLIYVNIYCAAMPEYCSHCEVCPDTLPEKLGRGSYLASLPTATSVHPLHALQSIHTNTNTSHEHCHGDIQPQNVHVPTICGLFTHTTTARPKPPLQTTYMTPGGVMHADSPHWQCGWGAAHEGSVGVGGVTPWEPPEAHGGSVGGVGGVI